MSSSTKEEARIAAERIAREAKKMAEDEKRRAATVDTDLSKQGIHKDEPNDGPVTEIDEYRYVP